MRLPELEAERRVRTGIVFPWQFLVWQGGRYLKTSKKTRGNKAQD
jgi:hypothetical protein